MTQPAADQQLLHGAVRLVDGLIGERRRPGVGVGDRDLLETLAADDMRPPLRWEIGIVQRG